MGNNTKNNSSFNNNHNSIQQLYSFAQHYQDQQFGNTKIYRSNFHRNEFVAQYTVNVQHERVQFIESCIRNFQQAFLLHDDETFPFLRIVHYTIDYHALGLGDHLTKSCTIPQLSIWVEFLRHNLKQFLNWRISEDRPLSIDEIRMAMQRALKANNLLRKNEQIGVSLNLQDISITIDGQIKFNPLLGKLFEGQCLTDNFSLGNNNRTQNNALKHRIVSKRTFSNSHQSYHTNSNNNKFISVNLGKEFLSPQSKSDNEFLYQSKRFANKLIMQCSCNKQNPQDSDFFEAKQIRLFLETINKATSLKELTQLVGNPPTNTFTVDYSKLKHQQSQSRFEKILFQLQQKSQRTDYTANSSSPKKQFSPRKFDPQIFLNIPSPQYHYY